MNPHQPRYFIGIALPQAISEQLFDFKQRLHKDIDYSLKPLVPHITLLHPSNLHDISTEEIIPKIRAVTTPYLPLTFSYGPIEHFESTVLYIRVHSPELEKLQQELVALLPPEAQLFDHQRRFIPHITLVQVRTPHTLDVETLKRRTEQEILLPENSVINAISYFTQAAPRTYDSMPIKAR